MSGDQSLDREAAEMEDELPALQADPNILKNPDLMISSDDDALSPRIGSRFHRPGLNRRRSSAASSRRNSLSSTHSQHSTKSYKLAVQSNHVAQHLRRASFLESRKARLADRAAHAELVRQRAAIAKATPKNSNSEEKAMAAAQAREKYLAQVAATCAEEVNRAKKVAEETKEKKAAEERRCRLEMEEKHAEAEKRRLEYLKSGRRPRLFSIPAAESKRPRSSSGPSLREPAAASRIQRAWRRHHRRKLVRSFMDLKLSIDRVRDISFMEASSLLADENVIKTTGDIMSMLDLDHSAGQDQLLIRRFLSAFMILGHATDVFNKHGQQEEDIIEKAKTLLISFESILSELTSSSSSSAQPTELETLSQAYSAYLTAFAAWKERDASVLIATMIDQFVAFDAIWQTVKDDTRGEVANDYREGIRDQQVILLSKIKKLAGPEKAHNMIKRAIRESRMARQRQRPKGDVRPREVAPTTAGSPGSSVSAASEIQRQASSEGPRDIERTELSRIFSVIPPNRVLVHELLIDPNFKIEVSAASDVRSALNREVCNSMRRGIEQGDGEIWTVAVAENIRKRLLKLLRPGNSMYTLLNDVLDSDHVQRQCRQGQFSYEKFFEFMTDLLPKLCAPFRDPEVKAFADSLKGCSNDANTMIEKLFDLLRIIDLMSLDYTNYVLQQAAPTLIREAAGYEQRMFAEDLQENRTSLSKTKRWWHHASINLHTENSSAESQGDMFNRVYMRGLVDLSIAPGYLQESDTPETLYLDHTRLSRFRSDMHRLVLVGAILLTAKNLLKRDVRSQWKPEAKRISELLQQYSLSDASEESTANLISRITATISSSHNMPQSTHDQLNSLTARFLKDVTSRRPFSDPVLKLLFQRIKAHMFARLSAQSSAEKVRVTASAGEVLAGIGLSEFISRVAELADELAKVAQVDLRSHEEWYKSVASELERIGEGEH